MSSAERFASDSDGHYDIDGVSFAKNGGVVIASSLIFKMEAQQSEKIYFDSDEYYADLVYFVLNAQQSIKFESYIFKFDKLGLRILEALGDAVKRGVKVSLRVDGIGSLDWLFQIAATAQKLNIEFDIYHPLPNFLRPYSFLSRLGKFNKRNHRKMCLIDSKIAFIGSMNVDRCHLKEFSGKHAWRDTGLRIEGTQVQILTQAFDKTNPNSIDLNHLVKLNNSLTRRRKIYLEFKKRIRFSQNKIWITSPYFNPPPFLLVQLVKAVRRGVDVRLLLGHKQDPYLMHWVNTYFYTYLLKNGVRIFEFLPSVLHAKTKILDDWMTVGSSNQNYRSYFYDLEVDLVLITKGTKDGLEQQFLNDLQLSKELKLIEWKKRSIFHILIEKFLSLFHRWV